MAEYTHETKLTERMLQAGIALIGVFIIGAIISALCWVIASIWNHIL